MTELKTSLSTWLEELADQVTKGGQFMYSLGSTRFTFNTARELIMHLRGWFSATHQRCTFVPPADSPVSIVDVVRDFEDKRHNPHVGDALDRVFDVMSTPRDITFSWLLNDEYKGSDRVVVALAVGKKGHNPFVVKTWGQPSGSTTTSLVHEYCVGRMLAALNSPFFMRTFAFRMAPKFKKSLSEAFDTFPYVDVDTLVPYLFLESVPGETLATTLQARRKWTFRQAASVLFQVAFALVEADDAVEFEHRDLHVGNIMIRPSRYRHFRFRFAGDTYVVSHPIPEHIVIIDYGFSSYTLGHRERVESFEDGPYDSGMLRELITLEFKPDFESKAEQKAWDLMRDILVKFASEGKRDAHPVRDGLGALLAELGTSGFRPLRDIVCFERDFKGAPEDMMPRSDLAGKSNFGSARVTLASWYGVSSVTSKTATAMDTDLSSVIFAVDRKVPELAQPDFVTTVLVPVLSKWQPDVKWTAETLLAPRNHGTLLPRLQRVCLAAGDDVKFARTVSDPSVDVVECEKPVDELVMGTPTVTFLQRFGVSCWLTLVWHLLPNVKRLTVLDARVFDDSIPMRPDGLKAPAWRQLWIAMTGLLCGACVSLHINDESERSLSWTAVLRALQRVTTLQYLTLQLVDTGPERKGDNSDDDAEEEEEEADKDVDMYDRRLWRAAYALCPRADEDSCAFVSMVRQGEPLHCELTSTMRASPRLTVRANHVDVRSWPASGLLDLEIHVGTPGSPGAKAIVALHLEGTLASRSSLEHLTIDFVSDASVELRAVGSHSQPELNLLLRSHPRLRSLRILCPSNAIIGASTLRDAPTTLRRLVLDASSRHRSYKIPYDTWEAYLRTHAEQECLPTPCDTSAWNDELLDTLVRSSADTLMELDVEDTATGAITPAALLRALKAFTRLEHLGMHAAETKSETKDDTNAWFDVVMHVAQTNTLVGSVALHGSMIASDFSARQWELLQAAVDARTKSLWMSLHMLSGTKKVVLEKQV